LTIAWKYPGQELQVIPAEYSQIYIRPSTYNEINSLSSPTPATASQQLVNCSMDLQCGAIVETWTGIDGISNVDFYWSTNAFTSTPNTISRLWDLLEIPSNNDEYYGDLVTGWLVPPVSGDFLFWIASDDNGEFFLNTDYSMRAEDNMRICYTPQYSDVREWNRSIEQKSEPIGLVASQPYSFEVSA
jgi:hypothetical protein